MDGQYSFTLLDHRPLQPVTSDAHLQQQSNTNHQDPHRPRHVLSIPADSAQSMSTNGAQQKKRKPRKDSQPQTIAFEGLNAETKGPTDVPSKAKKTTPTSKRKRKPVESSDKKRTNKKQKLKHPTPAKKPTAKPKAPVRVNAVRSPPFDHIQKPGLPVLIPRLHVREFIARFERVIQIPQKHMTILCNPFEAPEYLSFRHLVIALLKLIDYADDPPIEPAETKRRISELSRASEESGILWETLIALLSTQKEVTMPIKASKDSQEDYRMKLITQLIDLAVTGEYIRTEVEEATEEVRLATYHIVKDKAARRQDYEKIKATLQKKRLLLSTKDDLANWQTQWLTSAEKYKSKARSLDVDLFEMQRAKQVRSRPLGRDTRGNTYWVFARRGRVKPEDDLGCRLIIEASDGRAHPLCLRPRRIDNATNGKKTPASPSAACSKCAHETLPIPAPGDRAWFEVSQHKDAFQLARWVMGQATVDLEPKPRVFDRRSKDVKDLRSSKDATTSTSTTVAARSQTNGGTGVQRKVQAQKDGAIAPAKLAAGIESAQVSDRGGCDTSTSSGAPSVLHQNIDDDEADDDDGDDDSTTFPVQAARDRPVVKQSSLARPHLTTHKENSHRDQDSVQTLTIGTPTQPQQLRQQGRGGGDENGEDDAPLDVAQATINALNKDLDQGLLDDWLNVETLVRRIDEFAVYLQSLQH